MSPNVSVQPLGCTWEWCSRPRQRIEPMFLGWTNEMVASVVPSDLTALSYNSAPLLTRDGDRTVVWLDGEFDVATAALLAEALATASSLDDADQIVDLSGVTFLDAMTIGVLIAHKNRLRRQSRSLMLRCPSNFVRRVLDLCGLSALIEPVVVPGTSGDSR